MAEILDGKLIAKEMRAEMKVMVDQHVEQGFDAPTLAAVIVGDDPASQTYVRNKERACEKVGMKSKLFKLPASTTESELLQLVEQLNQDSDVNGILVQLPLPKTITSQRILDAISPTKDVDAFHPENVGLMSQGRPRFLPCTPHGVQQILHRYQIDAAGKNVVIVGRSDIVGKPLASMMVQRDSTCGPEVANATVTICHSRTEDLASVTSQADILVAAIGISRFIKADMVKDGAVIVDVGINREEAGLVGDVDFEAVAEKASWITPVPGGVGPMTVTMLLFNTLMAAKLQNQEG